MKDPKIFNKEAFPYSGSGKLYTALESFLYSGIIAFLGLLLVLYIAPVKTVYSTLQLALGLSLLIAVIYTPLKILARNPESLFLWKFIPTSEKAFDKYHQTQITNRKSRVEFLRDRMNKDTQEINTLEKEMINLVEKNIHPHIGSFHKKII